MSSPVPLPDLYFDSFFYPVAPIVLGAGALFNSLIYCLLSQSQTLFMFGKLQALSNQEIVITSIYFQKHF